VALRRRKSPDFVLDAVQPTDRGDEPDGHREVLAHRLVQIAASVGETADTFQGGLLAAQGVIDFVGVGLDRPHEVLPASAHRLLPATAIEFQNHISPGHGIEPEVAARRLTFDLWIEHPHGGLIHRQVTARLHRRPHAVIEGLEPAGDVFDPLHHLRARDDHVVPLPQLLFQPIERPVVVEAREDNVDR